MKYEKSINIISGKWKPALNWQKSTTTDLNDINRSAIEPTNWANPEDAAG